MMESWVMGRLECCLNRLNLHNDKCGVVEVVEVGGQYIYNKYLK
jgi:hypothetical protein